jgi:hypothetical protein
MNCANYKPVHYAIFSSYLFIYHVLDMQFDMQDIENIRFLALPDFLRSTVGLEWGPLRIVSITAELFEWESSGSRSRKQRLTAVVIRCADHATFCIFKSWY